jgi:hypothetical protein
MMTTIETFSALAAKHSDNQADRLAYHVGLLEAYVQYQEQLLQICQQELSQIITELSQEQA